MCYRCNLKEPVLDFKAEMTKLIDSVPERHREREAVRLAEEKRLKEERERLQEEAERRRNGK